MPLTFPSGPLLLSPFASVDDERLGGEVEGLVWINLCVVTGVVFLVEVATGLAELLVWILLLLSVVVAVVVEVEFVGGTNGLVVVQKGVDAVAAVGLDDAGLAAVVVVGIAEVVLVFLVVVGLLVVDTLVVVDVVELCGVVLVVCLVVVVGEGGLVVTGVVRLVVDVDVVVGTVKGVGAAGLAGVVGSAVMPFRT